MPWYVGISFKPLKGIKLIFLTNRQVDVVLPLLIVGALMGN